MSCMCGRKAEPQPALPKFADGRKLAIIVCEGNFTRGNAGISLVDIESGTVWDDVYFQANNRKIGDVLHSIAFKNKTAYAVVNNSSKIEVIDMETWKTKQTVNNLGSPRNLHFTGNGEAWLTELYDKNLKILNENTLEVIHKIDFPHWSEEMVQTGDTLYISTPDAPFLFLASVSQRIVFDSIPLPGRSSALVKAGNSIWVSHTVSDAVGLGLSKLVNGSVVHSFSFEGRPGLSHTLQVNNTQDYVYLLSQHLYKINISSKESSIPIFISGAGSNYYGFSLAAQSEELWLSDAIDFQQKGDIRIYTETGMDKNLRYKSGVIPSKIYFYNY